MKRSFCVIRTVFVSYLAQYRDHKEMEGTVDHATKVKFVLMMDLVDFRVRIFKKSKI